MEKLLKAWFATSQQGLAFLEPIFTSQLELVDFRYQLVNDAFATLIGKTEAKLTGQPISKVSPKLKNSIFSSLVTVVQTECPLQLYEKNLPNEGEWLHITLARMDTQVLVTLQDVTEQKKAEYNLQRRLEMESIVSSVSAQLINIDAGDLDACLIDSLGRVATYNCADRASIFVYSIDKQVVSCTHEWNAAGMISHQEHLQNLPLFATSQLHNRLENGEIIRLQVDDLPPDAAEMKTLFERIAIRSMIALPLTREVKTVRFLAFYAISHSQTWDENDISLLKTFSILIGNVQQRLLHEGAIRRINQRLEGLHTIDQALLSPRSIEQSPLLLALQYINAMVPCERLTLFRINEETGLATAEYRLAEGVAAANPGIVFSAHYFYDLVLSDGEASYTPDLQAETPGLPPELNLFGRGFRSLVVMPLYNRNVCIGAFTLLSTTPFFFTDEHLQIAQEVARPLAIVLYQQQLNKQLSDYTEQLEQRVAERTREISQLSALQQAILKHAGQAILSTDINGVIQTANQACEKLLDYRVEELIGRVTQVRFAPGEDSVPFISYHQPGSVELPPNPFQDGLASQGYFYSECIAIGKNGKQVPVLLMTSTLQDAGSTLIGYIGIAADITALKTAEANLAQKNQELNTFFDGALDMHCIIDFQSKIVRVNRAWETTLGFPASELASLPFFELVHPEERESVVRNFRAVIPHQPIQYQINRFCKKDGANRIVEWNAIGINTHIYVSARDITERQQTKIHSQNLNQRLQLATKAAGQGIWENDYEQDVMIWDDRMWAIHDREPEPSEWRFQEYLKMIHPADVPSFLDSYQRSLKDDVISNVTRILRPDGTVRYLENSGLVLRNQQGNPVRSIGVTWDVTERKLAEAALRESEQRFREIAENVDEVFWIHSIEPFEVLYINPAYERVFGISAAEVAADETAFWATFLEEDREMVIAEFEKYRQGQEVTVQCRVQGSHREIHWLQIRTFIMRDHEGVPARYIGIVNDISSQKETELVLKQSLQREQELNQLKSQFVTTASHEFRTPLTTIQTSADLIQMHLDYPQETARPAIQKYLSMIHQQIQNFNGLLSDMLSIGKIEAGKVPFDPQWVDLPAVCQRVISSHFSHQNDERTVRLSMEGTPFPVFLDEKLISHTLVNLLSNAFKFSTVDPRLLIQFGDSDLAIHVIDEGIGIPTSDLPDLFQTFFRARNTATIQGTGMGLVIARQFVELHGGTLTVQSEENKGSAFTILLPKKQDS